MKQFIFAGSHDSGLRHEPTTNSELAHVRKLAVSDWETSGWFIGWLKLARNKSQRSGQPQ